MVFQFPFTIQTLVEEPSNLTPLESIYSPNNEMTEEHNKMMHRIISLQGISKKNLSQVVEDISNIEAQVPQFSAKESSNAIKDEFGAGKSSPHRHAVISDHTMTYEPSYRKGKAANCIAFTQDSGRRIHRFSFRHSNMNDFKKDVFMFDNLYRVAETDKVLTLKAAIGTLVETQMIGLVIDIPEERYEKLPKVEAVAIPKVSNEQPSRMRRILHSPMRNKVSSAHTPEPETPFERECRQSFAHHGLMM